MLQRLVEEDKEILLVMHSHGGSLGNTAAKSLSVGERRQQGLKGGVLGQVFVAAMVVKEGESLLSALGGNWPEFMIKDVGRPFIFFQ